MKRARAAQKKVVPDKAALGFGEAVIAIVMFWCEKSEFFPKSSADCYHKKIEHFKHPSTGILLQSDDRYNSVYISLGGRNDIWQKKIYIHKTLTVYTNSTFNKNHY